MNTQHTTLPILAILVASLAFTHAAAAEVCRLDLDAPALVILETDSAITPAPARDAARAVVLEASASHLVLAVTEAGSVWLEGPAGCALNASVTRAEVRQQTVSAGALTPAVATSFHPLAFATKEEDHDFDPDPKSTPLPTKEEDHDFDPDPEQPFAGGPIVTLIELDTGIATKEEDHDFDPDPKNAPLPTKEEDHDFDPDPGQPFAGGWAEDWDATSAVVRQLGPGWYFAVRDGAAAHEILVEGR